MTATTQGSVPAGEWRANWTMMIPAVVGVMLSTVNSYSLGVMIGPLEKEFGWTRGQITAGSMILACIALISAPLVGAGIDRFGPRRIALFGVAGYCSAVAMFSTVSANIFSWWALWVLLALAGMGVQPTVWTAAINSLFDRSRGFALAIALCGTGLGAAIVPTVTYRLTEAYGWRGGYIGLGAIFAIIALPLVYFLFTSSFDRYRTASQRQRDASPATVLQGMALREALRSARFLKLAGAAFLIAIAVTAVIGNAVPILVSKGFDRGSAAGVAGLVGLGAIVGRLCGGLLLDRLKANRVAAVAVLLPMITASILLFAANTQIMASIALFVLGLSVGAELDACAYLAARHFGLRNFGKLFGIMNGLLMFSNGVSPFVVNVIYDTTKNYDFALWLQFPACLGSALLFFLLGPYPSDEKQGSQ